MKKSIVIYYSKNGSNEYLAKKIAKELKCEIEQIKPRINWFLLLLLSSKFNFSLGIRGAKHQIENYDTVILCGPIWMGQFLSPMRDFIKHYKHKIKDLHYISCCGSGEEDKDGKFGHGTVFKKVKEIYGDDQLQCTAFPIPLIVPEDKMKDGEYIMKTRLSDQNFDGEIQKRFDTLIQELQS